MPDNNPVLSQTYADAQYYPTQKKAARVKQTASSVLIRKIVLMLPNLQLQQSEFFCPCQTVSSFCGEVQQVRLK